MNPSLLSLTLAVPRLLIVVGLIAALGFAIARRRTLGRAASPAITGLALIIGDSLFSLALPLFSYLTLRATGPNFMTVVALQNFASAVLWGAGVALLIVAIFIGRNAVTPDPGQISPPAGPLV